MHQTPQKEIIHLALKQLQEYKLAPLKFTSYFESMKKTSAWLQSKENK